MPDPPLWVFRLLRRFCPPQLLEEIQGDLMQKYVRDCMTAGAAVAKQRLVWNTLRFFRPGILLRNRFKRAGTTLLLGSYINVSVRQMQKHKAFSLINVVGLGLAFCSSLLIVQYVTYELSFDKHFRKAERIFRVQEDRYKNGAIENRWAPAVGLVGPTLKEDFPEVEEYAQVFPYQLAAPAPVVYAGERFFKEDKTYMVTEGFFRVFAGKLLRGDPSGVLGKPYCAVISRSMSERLFGTVDPVGRVLNLDKAQDFQVTGVFEDFPANSHFHPQLLLSMETMTEGWDYKFTWGYGGFHTYVLLRQGTDPAAFQSKLPEFVTRRAGEQLKIWEEEMVLNLQRIDNIHLDSNFIWEHEENGSRARTYFMAVIAVLIVLIAVINYINLSIAKSITRAKEVGIRKVVGGLRRQLVQQFLFESIVIHLIALVFGVTLLYLTASGATRWFGIYISLDFISSTGFWYGLTLILLASICISSLYPALRYSRFSIIAVLKGGRENPGAGTKFFGALTVAQITTSVILMITTWCVYAQISFVQNANNGFADDQILVLRAPNDWDSSYVGAITALKVDLMRRPGVEYVVATSDVPGQVPTLRAGGVRKTSDPKSAGFDCTPPNIDYNYVEMLGLKLLAGRSFSEALGDDYSKVLVNEAAMTKLGIDKPEDAVGVQITFWGDTYQIIGVLKDYHHESMRKAILPMIFRFNPLYRGYISIKSRGLAAPDLIHQAEQAWNQHFQGYPFEYFFLDENFDKQYVSDQQFKRILTAFALIAIFIACIGLFGLSMLTAARSVKEIAVRKVLGATTIGIVALLSRKYAALLVIASALALPAAWVVVDRWLQGFVVRVHLSVWYFVLPVGMAAIAALVAAGLKTLDAARANPVVNLKHE